MRDGITTFRISDVELETRGAGYLRGEVTSACFDHVNRTVDARRLQYFPWCWYVHNSRQVWTTFSFHV